MRAIDVQKRLAHLASGQWGLFTTLQATALGVSHSQLTRLVEGDVLSRLSHGVYQMHSAPSDRHTDLRAAWLALAPKYTAGQRLQDPDVEPIVSHASAASLRDWGDLTAYTSEFTYDGRKQTRRSGIRIHRGPTPASDIDVVDGLPTTTAERLIADLIAADYDTEHVGAVLAEAIRGRSVDLDHLAERIAPYAARRGFGVRAGADLVAALVRSGGAEEEAVADTLVRLARSSPGRSSGLASVVAEIQRNLANIHLPELFDPATRAAIEQNLANIQLPQLLDPATLSRLEEARRILDHPATKRAIEAARQYR